MDTTTEFEISKEAAASFAAMIRRPDKEDNIRIEALAEAPQGQGPSEKRSYPPRREAGTAERGPRHERAPKPHGKPANESGSGFGREPGFEKKKKYSHKPAHAGPPPHASAGKPAFGKKKKKNRGG
jgi:ATP-dependent RNA helicase DeaD